MWTSFQFNQLRALSIWGALLVSVWMLAAATPLWAQDFPEPNVADDRIAMVHLNEDDAMTLAALLTGIGETRALAIVAYREANGPFNSIDELTLVSGIGPATVAANRDRLVLHASDVAP